MLRLSRFRSSFLLTAIVAGVVGTAAAQDPAPPVAAPTGTPPAPAPQPTAPAEPPPAETPPAETPPPTTEPATTPPAEPPLPTPPENPPAPAVVADPGSLTGSIIDNNTKIGLPAATIQVTGVAGGDLTAVAELDGTYAISLPAGTYKVTFSTPDYIEQTRTVTVVAGKAAELSLNLDPVPIESGAETIEIVDRLDTRREAAVLAVRRAASVLSDAVSSQEISRTPDSSASDAVKRVVAVSVLDGKYVALRGLEGRYVTTLLNGILLPSPEPDRNAVPLDLFPTNLLSTMTVMKSYSPDLPGQFGGGTLSIDTNSFPTSFELKLGVSSSANTASTGAQGLQNAHSNGLLNFLGFDNGDRALPAEVPRNRAVRGMQPADMERIGESMPNVWTPKGETVTPNLGLNATIGDTVKVGGKRLGYLGTAMMRRVFAVREGSSGKVALAGGQLMQTDNLGYATGTAESTVGVLGNAGIDLTPNHEISLFAMYTHVGEDVTSFANGYSEADSGDIDVTRIQFVERSLAFGQLHGKHHLVRPSRVELRWQANVATTSRSELDSKDLIYLIDTASGTRQYKDQPGSGQHFWQVLNDLSGGAGADLRTRVGSRLQLRAGGLAQLSSRELGGRRFRYRFVGSDQGVRGLPGEDMFSETNIGPNFRLEEDTLQEDAYQASLDTYAGFVSAEIELHEKFRAIGGARYERSAQEMSNGSRYAIAGLETNVSRTDNDVLPALNLVYSPNAETNIRAAYSYTLTRPRFRELAPFLFFDYIRRRDISGNPMLETTHLHNVDVRWEWFPGDEEVFAASAFYKQFVDPIEQVLSNALGDATFENAKGGNLAGLELEIRTSLRRLAPELRRMRVGTNVAVMRSRVQLREDQLLVTSKQRPVYGQSPYVINVSLGYADPRVADINLLYNVIGPRITDVGVEGLPDTYEQPLHRLDIVASRDLNKQLRIKASVSNFLNQKITFKQDDIIVNRYQPGVSFSLGLDWTP